VGGDISLGGTLALTLGLGIEMNDTFVLLLNSGDNAIDGQFSAITVNGDSITLGEGNQFTYNSLDFRLLYDGNADGGAVANDLELVVVPEPTTWALVAGGLGMLALGRRMRRFSREA
jgi:hypothetical protein